MVERFKGRMSEVVNQTRFQRAAELKKTLFNDLYLYNEHIPPHALGHKTLGHKTPK